MEQNTPDSILNSRVSFPSFFFFLANRVFYNPNRQPRVTVMGTAKQRDKEEEEGGEGGAATEERKKQENKSITNFGRDGAHRFVLFRFRCRSYEI